MSFLDNTGVQHLWEKIKELVDKKILDNNSKSDVSAVISEIKRITEFEESYDN